MDGIDWDEWIRSDADNINQLRGMSQPRQQPRPTQTQPTRMGGARYGDHRKRIA